MTELTRSVQLKLKRANAQASELKSSVTSWTQNHPTTLDCELLQERKGFRLVVKQLENDVPFEEWGLRFGECLHNLRSALDNLAFALARLRLDPPQSPTRVAFPIYDERDEFQRSGRKKIDQLPDEAAALVEKLQPFQRDGSVEHGAPDQDPLLLLQFFNNADKHRVPALVLVAPNNVAHNFSVEFQREEDRRASDPSKMVFFVGPLAHGEVVAEWQTAGAVESVQGKFEIQANVAIAGPGDPINLFVALDAITYYTSLVISQFDAFFHLQANAK